MKRALCLIRPQLVYRREAFCSGLKAVGYKLVDSLPKPEPDDLLIIWNRYGMFHETANRFERVGARVIVAENGYVKRGEFYALARSHHSGAGEWAVGGPERWDSFGIELQPWKEGCDLIILGQRGIGESGIAAPKSWAESVRQRYGGKVRSHPGNGVHPVPLDRDLRNAFAVATWHSAAAFEALILGVPVFCDFPRWIGMSAATPLSEYPKLRTVDRLQMFRRLAWAQWRLDEIRSGEAFRWLLP